MNGWVDLHRRLVRVVAGDLLIHLEEVSIAGADGIFAVAGDGIGKVEIHSQSGNCDTAFVIAGFFGGPGSDVAWAKVAEGGVLALKIVVAIFLGDVRRFLFAFADCFGVFARLWNPDPPIVTEGLGHEGQLGLIVATNRDTGWVDLGVAGVCHVGAPLVRAVGGHDIAAHGISGEVKNVSVSPGGEDHRIGGVRGDCTGDEITNDDAFGVSVYDHKIEHLVASVHFDTAFRDFLGEGLIASDQELLTGLAAGVKSAFDLCSSEGAVVE